MLVRDRLAGKRIGVVALGDLPGDTSAAIEEALGPTGARLVGIGVVREPVDLSGLAGDLVEDPLRRRPPQPGNADRIRDGRRPPAGSRRHPARPGPQPPLLPRQRQLRRPRRGDRRRASRRKHGAGAACHRGAAGIGADGRDHRRRAAPAVGVETSTAEPSSISFFQGNDLSSVDDVEPPAGKLATVFALLGAEGSFGVKGSADRLLPDLLPHRGVER